MRSILLVLSVLFVTNVFAQEKALSISYANSDKVQVFRDNKRIRIKTVESGKLSGKLKILDDERLMIRNVIIPISSIEKIKNNPLALNLALSGVIVVTGAYTALAGLVAIYWAGVGIGLTTFVVGGGIITVGILSPNFLPATHITNDATIKVIQLME
jgi:hypothetical protein